MDQLDKTGARGYPPAVLISPIPEKTTVEDGPYVGHAPSVLIGPAPTKKPKVDNPEAARYQRMWALDGYRQNSPGEQLAMRFLAQARPPKNAECIDFGCGTGRGALMLALFGHMKVTMLDFADNCLDPEVRQALTTQKGRLKFFLADLTKGSPVTAPYGYCCDVLEHIHEQDVPKTIRNILAAAHHVFFNIYTEPDEWGPLAKEGELHLTVRPMDWWLKQLEEAGAVVHWSENHGEAFSVYCSGWKDPNDVWDSGRVNTEQEVIDRQVRTNIEAGWKHAHPYDRQDREVILLAGGPSINEHVAEIRQLREEGAALITTNGSYSWAISKGLKPSMQIVVDAREFNARFVKPAIPDCLYLMSSQVHPKTLEGLPHDRTFLWHSGINDELAGLVREKTGMFFPVPGGSTVVLRAIPLLRMLGFWRMHIFGFDSCVDREVPRWRIQFRSNNEYVKSPQTGEILEFEREEEAEFALAEVGAFYNAPPQSLVVVTALAHHAYSQPENNDETLFPVSVGGRQFWCSPWMVSQASEFRALIRSLGDEVELNVVGDGLIAHMIRTGAEAAALEASVEETTA